MKIAILRDGDYLFEGEQYIVDLSRKFEGYEPGDLKCYCNPFIELPLKLEIAIRKNGDIIFREWKWTDGGYCYLQTDEISEKEFNEQPVSWKKPFIPTKEQIDTVNGLFSGRIKFDGLKLAPGASLQKICPINVKREEKLIGEKIYLA